MATRERESLETRCVESLLVAYMCVLAISNGCQKTVPLPISVLYSQPLQGYGYSPARSSRGLGIPTSRW
jgi:hypothetical protein